MSLFYGTPLERSQQARDDYWKQVEEREARERFAEIDFTAERLAKEQAEAKAKEKTP